MLKCVFCGHEFQGNQFVAARHFRQGKGCPKVTDEALVDIHYNSEYKVSDKFLERIQRFEELHGAAPAMDPRQDEGGEGEMRDAGEQIDVDDDVEEVARAGSSGKERGKGIVSEPGGQQGHYFASAHVSASTWAGADTAEAVRPAVAGYRSSCDVHVDVLLFCGERNWAVHEGVQTKKRNRLEFEKVAKLVEISANIRLLSHQRAGRGFALPWTLDESLLDVEGGIGIRPSWKGTDESRTREEVEDQRRSWQRDPCGSRAPPGDVGDVFGTRAATLHPYPRDDSDSEGHEDEDEPAGPASATPAADERDEWSDPEDVQSGIDHRPLGCSGTTSSSALPTSTEKLHRQPAGADRLQRLVRGPRQRLEDRLEGGPMPVQGDDGDRQGLVGGDGGALAGGGGGAEVDAAVEGIPMGGGGGCSELGDMGMPPGESVGLARGESESRGDISVGMPDLLGQIGFADPSSFSPAMRAEVMLGAEGDEDRTPPGETSAERLDRLDSRRACLMAQRDPRTQELACLAAEDRQRQLGTYTPASVDVGPASHTDTSAEVHDTTQREAASAEVSSTGVDVQQGTHESGLAPTEEPRSEPAQPPAVQLRPEETLHEVAGVPLPAGSVEGAVHMSPGLEDIQTGQSVGIDDIRPSAQAEGIAPTTGGDGAVAGAVGVGGSGVSSAADPMSASGGGDPAQVDRRDADG
ncbi:hypothetical protein CBR_g16824 [Chara braunii]|uniref:Uncharacterized protein n=1 Tax=Chara braunii TaxID=69332 RepID=A0A388KU61_CHABU|nr:hypothetical protein CBR_g16824 [Chara braunii]|eukprot:GBG73483.1 hypothetical protein CBR_g16824 [Chara braunii]